MKALITGIRGFVAGYLAELLIDAGHEVWGTARSIDSCRNANSAYWDKVTLVKTDFNSQEALETVLQASRPEVIFHLAAQSSVQQSWVDKEGTFNANLLGTVRLLEAVRKSGENPKVLLVGSAEEYGLVSPKEVPVKETNPLRPMSPYGASKAATSMLAAQYFRAYKIPIIYARPFNHIGPRQSLGFVTSDFAKQIAEIELGLLEPIIRVGNLEAQRDFTDVRDVVRAYYLLSQKGQPGEIYNVSSGQAVPIEYILQTYLELAKVKISVEADPARMRPSDVPILLGESNKLNIDTGWKVAVPLLKSLADVLEYWRLTVANR
ncbi:MAG: GDP-mannose 4,6-dehydratase [Carboxydocellales bacterium]